MRHRGYIPKRHRGGAQGGDREPALEAGALRWCPTYTTPSLLGFPKPLVWKENTHLRCHGHPQKSSLAAAYLPLFCRPWWFPTKLSVRAVAYFFSPLLTERCACWAGCYGKTNSAGLKFAACVNGNLSSCFRGSVESVSESDSRPNDLGWNGGGDTAELGTRTRSSVAYKMSLSLNFWA